MNEPKPDDDENVDVKCVKCHDLYVTSHNAWKHRECACPRCGSNRAQLMDTPKA
jgi:Zn finger protein HypA/HybF involved in hydrogenase expression